MNRERRKNLAFVSLEEIEQTAPTGDREPDIDQQRALQQLSGFIRQLKPLDRQIMISYLEEMDIGTIAEITGISSGNVRMKIHRIKNILSSRFLRRNVMSDQTKGKDPECIWRDQPEEKLPVNLDQIVNRRTKELYSSTRSEILMSIGAALLLVGIVAWRLEIAHERLLEFGFAAVIA